MAITSAGNKGTVNATQWADLVERVGASSYGVDGPGDFQVSAVAGQDRPVSVGAGKAWGHGVIAFSDANETRQLGTIASGSRWDLVVLRRTWTSEGGATTVEVVPGGSAMALPARNNVPGTLDDQPLALVQVTAGQTQPTAIVDLRVWARTGGAVANHDLVRSYVRDSGTMLVIGSKIWQMRVSGAGLPEWVDLTAAIVALASAYSDGQLSVVKNFVDAATSSSGAGIEGKLVERDSNGLFGVRPPALSSHPTTKKYVDELVDDVVINTLDVMPRVFGDRVEITPSKADTPASKVVNFPPNFFRSSPVVVPGANTGFPANVHVGITDVTKTSCRVWVERNSTTTTGVYIIAAGN